MFGNTLGSLDNEARFFEHTLVGLGIGDLLLIDFLLAYFPFLRNNSQCIPRRMKETCTRYLAALAFAIAAAAGCTPAILGAQAIHPAMTSDAKETWIFLRSEDKLVTGVYRCYDNQQAPICQKAKLQNK